jgi:hypothetical protein
MPTTHRRLLALPPARIALDEGDLDALVAVMTSDYPTGLPVVVSLVTERGSRHIEEPSAKAFLKAVADMLRPLDNLTVTATFEGGNGKLALELSPSVARITAIGTALTWVQRKPDELQNWFKARALWYGPYAIAIQALVFIFFLSLIFFVASRLPGSPSTHGARDQLSVQRFIATVLGAGLLALMYLWSQYWFPKAIVTDRPRASIRVTDVTTTIAAVVAAIGTIVLAIFQVLTYLNAAL